MSGKYRKCEEYKEYTEQELTAFALGELGETRAAEIQQLLSEDPPGRQAVDELRGVAGLLTEQLASEPFAELTAAQRKAVESGGGQERAGLRLHFHLRIPLSLAASILILLGAWFMITNYWPESSPPITRNPVGPSPHVDDKILLEIKCPKALHSGTPVPTLVDPKPIYVPRGTSNLAAGKTVTSNAQVPVDRLKMITDGDKSGEAGHYLEIGEGLKWVQIDLGVQANVYAVAMWHYYDDGQLRQYRDVIVQVSGDPEFSKYKTVFNSNRDKSSGLEIGVNDMYFEGVLGRVIDCKGLAGRYVRLYSRGNTLDDQNHYIEVEVHGVKTGAKTTVLTPAPTPTAVPVRRRVKTVPLVIKYPKAKFKGTPVRMPNEPNVPKRRQRYPELLVVPEGTTNLALGKPVTSNELLPLVGELDMVTDGDKGCEDGHNVDLGFGLKWVQIDLQSVSEISAICMWHYCRGARAYRDLVVRVSDDPDFVTFTTLFNTDFDHSAGLGIGSDMGYIETVFGKLINCEGVRGRYVRLYSNGNTSNDQNHYIEVEVYGRTIKAPAPPARPEGIAERQEPLKIKFPRRLYCD
jgi:hypothetical protein